jgi:hypothetical protein
LPFYVTENHEFELMKAYRSIESRGKGLNQLEVKLKQVKNIK